MNVNKIQTKQTINIQILTTIIKVCIAMLVFQMGNSKFLFSQESNTIIIDSLFKELDFQKSQDSFESYYSTLREIDNHYVEEKTYDNLYLTGVYYEYLPITTNDSLVYRRFLMYHAEKIKKYHNDYYGSLQYYIKAHKHVYNKEKLDKWSFWIENTMGNIYARLNDYDKALYYYNISLIPCARDNKKLSRLYANIGNVYRWMKNDKMTRLSFDNGIKYGKKSKSLKGLQAIHANYADYYLSKDNFDQFKYHIEISRKYLDNLVDLWSYTHRQSELLELEGDAYNKNKNYDNAIHSYQKSIDGLTKFYQSIPQREIAKLHQKKASIYLMLSNLESCNNHISNAFKFLIKDFNYSEIPLKSDVTKENTFTDLLSLKAKYYNRLYERSSKLVYLDSAFMSIDMSIDANDQLDSMLIMHNSKYESIAQNKVIVSQAVEYCYQAYLQSNNPKYLYKIRKYIDLSKSQLLLENQQKNNLINRMYDVDKFKLNKLELQLINLEKTDMSIESTQKLKIRCHEAILDIHRKYISEENWNRDISEPYLEYVQTTNAYYLFTNVIKNKIVKIGNRIEIDELISDVLLLIRNKDQIKLMSKLEMLYEVLIPIDISSYEEVTIIPDGNISFVPFDILRTSDHYLLEQIIIKWRYHTKVLNVHYNVSEVKKMYILQPSYENGHLDSTLIEYDVSVLPFAKREVDSIKAVFRASYKIDRNVSLQRLKNEVANCDIFHFSGHAIVNADSAFMLLMEGDHLIKLTDDQIFYMTNNIELVTLSACETGLGEFKNGEGIRSLANAFLNSGANSIVYSLWNANDISTSSIMTCFYRNMELGLSKAKALNKAKRDFLSKTNPSFRHPYYWAAFIIADNTENHTVSHSFDWCLGTILCILLFLGLYFFKTKTKQL